MATTWETVKPTRTATYWGKTMDDTRGAAFDSIDTVTLRSLTLEEIGKSGPHGLTADQVAKLLEIDKLAIRPRVSELKAQGRIVDSGERRPNESGRQAAVFVLPSYVASPEPEPDNPATQQTLF